MTVAIIVYVLGAPFAAALEVIVYAGTIMVLFVFVLILLNIGGATIPTGAALVDALDLGWTNRVVGNSLILLGELVYLRGTIRWPLRAAPWSSRGKWVQCSLVCSW